MEDPMKECILLAACGANEMLPQNPDLPADVFTACLTTPIKAGCSSGHKSLFWWDEVQMWGARAQICTMACMWDALPKLELGRGGSVLTPL